MWLGVDYYPEQWDESLMSEDMDNIVEMGGNIIRIAEFAWHMMELQEGRYDFSYFDKVIELAKVKNLHIIMGTPTATIPAWLAKKHPDILSEFENGRKRVFGGRHVFCFNSPVMWEYSERIIRELAQHFKDEGAIAAWQIDNELGHEGSDVCYCENCHKAFQSFLKSKFHGDIEALNRTYGTTFWSQEYNEFEEIPIPAETITTHNPALRLDWERFRSESIVKFAEFQAGIIKEIIPGAKIIHDFPGGGLDKHCDYSRVAECLDIAAYNNYPVWGGQKEPLPPHEIAFGLDYIRGLKGDLFWITEQIMGAQGHDVTGFLPRPGQAKLWSCQGMARGCDSLLYFRYRGALKGAEQFCYGILDADNRKGRKFFEVRDFFHNIIRYEKALEEPILSQAAVIYDYDSLASFRIQRQSIVLDCQKEMQRLYRPLYDGNVMTDIIPQNRDFSKYKVVIVPLMILAKAGFQERMKEYVKNGGVVVLTYRDAVKDQDNNLMFGETLPAGYTKMAGIFAEEFESVQSTREFPLIGTGRCEGRTGYGGVFRDMLAAQEAEVLYRYGDSFYDGYAAVTRNTYGKGRVYYIGCSPDDGTAAHIMGIVMEDAGITPIESPDGVEVVYRGKGDHQIRMWMNHNEHTVHMGDIELGPFEFKVDYVNL